MTFKTLKSSKSQVTGHVEATPAEAMVKSPCVSVCVLNDEDICVGCYRTGEEISKWGRLDNDGKRAVLSECHGRARKMNPFL
ncbi:DUF1289 domain-containing protein [Sessilibacter corallicola]|uniref:DUF1289 domain-containing protein n=1 Tax=Sessilibacter corallicola TaxID=2904075 RepID=UPI0033130508